MLQLAEYHVPNGHEEPEPELSPAPEEGSYLWHLLRLRNTAALNLMVYHSAYEIRENHLYRPQYRDWSEFCRNELDKSENNVNRLIQAASMIQELRSAGCKLLPIHPSSIRPLSLLPEFQPFLRAEAWDNACSLKSPGHLPTRADVMREVRKFLGRRHTETNATERKIFHDLRLHLRKAKEVIREAQDLFNEPATEVWLQDRATVAQRRLLDGYVTDIRERLDDIVIDTTIY